MSTADAVDDPVRSPESITQITEIVRAWGPLSDAQRAIIRAAFAPAIKALARKKPPEEAA